MPFGFGDDRGGWPSVSNDWRPRQEQPEPAAEPEPQAEPAPEPAPEPVPEPQPVVEQPAEPEPEPESAPEPNAETESESGSKPDAKAKAKRKRPPRRNVKAEEQRIGLIVDARRMLDRGGVRDVVMELTGKETDEDLTLALLRLKPNMANRMPERKDVRSVLDALGLLSDGRVRSMLATVVGGDGEAAMVAAILDGRLEPARLLVDAHDESDPLSRMVLLLSAGEKDAGRLRAAAKLLVQVAPDVSDRVRPMAGSQLDLARAMADALPVVDVEPLRGVVR